MQERVLSTSFKDSVRDGIIVSKHHLASEGSFNEFQLIVAPHIDDVYAPMAAYRGRIR
ncbi:MAG: hypothetical protein JO060_10150 [Candidatus Eremiobacteraeota bacterium]|nr:hypothetical protein [Candidatus Eremiobacteraeota bacterium]